MAVVHEVRVADRISCWHGKFSANKGKQPFHIQVEKRVYRAEHITSVTLEDSAWRLVRVYSLYRFHCSLQCARDTTCNFAYVDTALTKGLCTCKQGVCTCKKGKVSDFLSLIVRVKLEVL